MKKVPLTNGGFAQVDDADFDRVVALGHWWKRTNDGYAGAKLTRGRGAREVLMHRFILEPPSNLVIDHINFDTLDNRRKNLRLCTRAQNNQHVKRKVHNTSGFKGVSWNEEKRKFAAYINANGHRKRLGYFPTAHEAASAYNDAAVQLHGEFASLNPLP